MPSWARPALALGLAQPFSMPRRRREGRASVESVRMRSSLPHGHASWVRVVAGRGRHSRSPT
eukprot:2829374-Alexandrium_andersonii.AAC.1